MPTSDEIQEMLAADKEPAEPETEERDTEPAEPEPREPLKEETVEIKADKPKGRYARLNETVASLSEELKALRAERASASESARAAGDEELRAIKDELRQAREALSRAAQPRGGGDTDAEDGHYAAAIKDLRKQRWAALARSDADAVDEAEEAIMELKAEQKAKRILAEYQAQQPRPPSPELAALEHEFSDIKVKPGWQQTVRAWDESLAAQGQADGPARWRKAFELAAVGMGVRQPSKPAGASAAQRARTLATGDAGGGAGSNGASRYDLPPDWREAARKWGKTEEEYKRSVARYMPGWRREE